MFGCDLTDRYISLRLKFAAHSHCRACK